MNRGGNDRRTSHPIAGTSLCQVEHVGLVISGQAACKMEDGRSYVMKSGDIFYIGPGHDSWVVGDRMFPSISSEPRNTRMTETKSCFEINKVKLNEAIASGRLNRLERTLQIVD